jgi:hypothetical protein
MKFGRRLSSGDRSGGKKKQEEGKLVSKDEFKASREQGKGASRELYKYDAPTQSLGMSDLIKQHNSGERFLYGAVSGRSEETSDSRLRRLINFTPPLHRKIIPYDNLPNIPLFKETENFPLSPLIKKTKDDTRPYVRIADAVVIYGALISTDSEFTKIHLSIMDNRMLNNKTAKTMTATSNIEARANLQLSYCFPKAEAEYIALSITRENRFMEEGLQWGVIRIELVLEELAFPIQVDNDPVVATNVYPKTLMEDREIDPDKIDISITNSDRKKLAEIYMEGDIADTTEPVVNRTEAVKYAKSSLAGPKGKKKEIASKGEWSFMSNKRVGLTDADNNSVSIDEEGSIKSSSSMGEKLKMLDDIPEGIDEKTVPRSILKNRDSRELVKRTHFADDNSENEVVSGEVKSKDVYVFN